MENSGAVGIRLETYGRRRIISWAASYVVALALTAIVVAIVGPDALQKAAKVDNLTCKLEKEQFLKAGLALPPWSDEEERKLNALQACKLCGNYSTTWVLEDMNARHQFIHLSITVRKPNIINFTQNDKGSSKHGFKFVEKITVSARGQHYLGNGHFSEPESISENQEHDREFKCKKKTDECESVTLFSVNYVTFDKYIIDLDIGNPWAPFCEAGAWVNEPRFFEKGVGPSLEGETYMTFVSSGFTIMELAMKYLYLTVTCIVLWRFVRNMKAIPRSQRSYEQWWIRLLLCALIFFNDPLAGLQIKRPNISFTVISVLGTVTFLALLLLFWLCTFHVLASPRSHLRKGKQFYRLKILLTFLFWTFTLVSYVYTRVQQERDPAYNFEDLKHFGFAKVAAIILSAIYMLLLFKYALEVRRAFNSLSYVSKYLFLLSLFTILVTTLGVFAGAMSPVTYISLEFAVYMSVFNFYVWNLAFSFSPSARFHYQMSSSPAGRAAIEDSVRLDDDGDESSNWVVGEAPRDELRPVALASLDAPPSPKVECRAEDIGLELAVL